MAEEPGNIGTVLRPTPFGVDPDGGTDGTPAENGGLSDSQLRATPVAVSISASIPLSIAGTVTANGPLTNTQLRASAVPVSGPLTDVQLRATPVSVLGPLTDTQLRATPVPVSGTVTAVTGGLTDAELRATPVPVSGPLTDTQLRATPVPVSGTVTAVTGGLTDAELRATPVPVSGPLTDAQLRATPVPVSGTVTSTVTRGLLTDRSGSITTGGTSQTLAASNATRSYFIFLNISVESLYLNFTSAATNNSGTPNSIEVKPAQSFVMESSFLTTELITVIGATTGSKWAAKEN